MFKRWNDKCNPPWTYDELRAKVASASRNGTPRPLKIVEMKADAKVAKTTIPTISNGLVSMSDIKAQRIEWLWKNFIPTKTLAIIAGNPGCNKSTIALDIASHVSNGLPFADGSDCPKGSVLLLSAEDDPSSITKPRLKALGADMSKIFILKSDDFKLDEVDRLREYVNQIPDCKLIIVDTINSHFGKADSHKSTDVTQLLVPLSQLASEKNLAIVGIHHLNKQKNGTALNRLQGSTAFQGSARSVIFVAKAKSDRLKRYFINAKINSGRDGIGIAFSIVPIELELDGQKHETIGLKWSDESVSMTADEALSDEMIEGKSKVIEAEEWLCDALALGMKESNWLVAEALKDGIAKQTLWDAKDRLKNRNELKVEKKGFQGQWFWSLKNPPTPPIEDEAPTFVDAPKVEDEDPF